MRGLVIVVLAALALAGCATQQASETVDTPSPTVEIGATFWDNIPVGSGDALRAYVDELSTAGDCVGLQEVFDTWDQADFVVDFTSPLLDYIDNEMEAAGCYE